MLLRRRALVTSLAVSPMAARAQGSYPNRSVRILVGSAPGGATDITIRVIADAMGADFPRGFAIENRTGAGGTIAAQAGARAAPDGYTLLVADATMMTINPVLFRNIPFDAAADFTSIAKMAEYAFVFVLHPSVPARNMAEFAVWAKAQPDPVLFASPNPGSPHHLAMEIVAQRMGFRVQHVGFRGGGPATTALLGGQMLVGSVGLPPLVTHLREGRLRGLAISTPTRSSQAPDVPTISEAGLPGLSFESWFGLVGPRGLPAEVVTHISRALDQAIANPEVVQKLDQQGLVARYKPPAEFDAFFAAQRASWGEAARASGVVIE